MVQCISIVLCSQIYAIEAIESSLYKYANLFVGTIELSEGSKVNVTLNLREGESLSSAELKELFLISLNEENLKQKVAERTHKLRDLIMAHAFSKAVISDA
jgi:His-Xaa-Ser system protein HxsD